MFSSKTMELYTKDSVGFLKYPALEKFSWLNHAFSTRLGGVSTGEFSTMNLSFRRGDPDANVLQNYKLFTAAAGFDFNTLVASAQDHNTVVRHVTAKEHGIGIWKESDMESVDALITNEPNVTLVTYYADCTPVFFVDPIKKAIGLAHAGWRGTVGMIAKEVVKSMQMQYGSDPKDIVAAIGPVIMQCCYEIDESCYQEFKSMPDIYVTQFIIPKDNGKYMADLLSINKAVLLSAGVLNENITLSDICTKCNSELLFSHRATGGKRGGMCAMMAIR
ncbi:MAG: peptidoglycan editing factor PgeF [Bacillota bacterium]|nr:peptidoglycan editing factor PgeF [Bacillota bacterium]